MDISKASNFERFVFDLVGRDADVVKELWSKVEAGASFDLAATPHFRSLPRYAMVSGSSAHQDRIVTIRDVWKRYGTMIDTHTADGLKIACEHRQPNTPMIVLETAQAVKFSETIVEALGREPERPAELEGIEQLPQRVQVMKADSQAIKDFIVRACS